MVELDAAVQIRHLNVLSQGTLGMPANSHITLNNNGTASGFVLTKTGGGRIDPSEGVVTLVGNGRISDSLLFSEVECVGPGTIDIYI